MSQQTPAPPADKDSRRLLAAALPLALIMALMLVLSLASVLMVSSLRAYAHGHARWAIAENEAIYSLHHYAKAGHEADYQRFRAEMAVPLGDRAARLQLQSSQPDYDAVRRGLLAGRNAPADIPGLIRLFRLFEHHPLMVRAVERWASADALIEQLDQTGARIHALRGTGNPDPAQLEALLSQAEDLHARIRPPLNDFGYILGEASRQIAHLLLIILPLCCLALVLLGIAISRALGRRADHMSVALHEMTDRLRFQATHDSLTGLTNRAEFEMLLETAITEQRVTQGYWALLYFDLDQFKIVNDTCGHAAGDELIKQIAWRIRSMVGEQGTAARLGGDEFGVLVPHLAADAAVHFAEGIREQIDELRFYWKEKTFAVSASIGVVLLGEGLPSVTEALSAADQACYLAKNNGRNRVQLYHPDDRQVQTLQGDMNWVERLQAALDHDGFLLAAQEIQPIGAKEETGLAPRRFELLLRMNGADGRPVAPMAFIPAAERFGLMPRLDRWVIARACRELAGLRARGIPLPICMINVSGTSVGDPDLADYIATCLRDNDLPGSYIGFELTETAAVGNIALCSEFMARLRALGCLIALDDFGTGMSSFSYLRNMPIDLLKIDRGFIRNISTDPIDYALVETIKHIGDIMGVRTVAEGVESEAILASLTLIGVDFAQGLHLARPVPLSQIQWTQDGASAAAATTGPRPRAARTLSGG